MSSARTELRALARLAGPLALANAGNQLISTVDAAIVGRLGALELAAVGLGNALYFFLIITGMGVMLALDPLVSQALGAGDEVRARRWLWQGVWLSLAVSVAISVPGALAPALLVPFGIEEEVARQAGLYLWIRLPGTVPFLLFVAMRSYLAAHGITRPMLVAVVAANVVNLVATWLLVFGGADLPAWAGPLRLVPALGVAGAAIASTLTLAAQAGVVALHVRAVPLPHRPADLRRPSSADLRTAFRVGLPIGLQMAAEVGVFSLTGLLAGRVGTVALAAHQIALTLASLTFTVAIGIGAAGGVRVGRAIGAGDAPGTRRAGLVALAVGSGYMALNAGAFVLAGGPLVRLVTDQAEVIAMAVPLLAVAGVFQISDGLQGVAAGVLRGAGDTRWPFVWNVVGHYAVGLPIAVVLGLSWGLGVAGLWWGLAAGLTVVAVALVTRFVRLSRRPIAPIAHGAPAPAD